LFEYVGEKPLEEDEEDMNKDVTKNKVELILMQWSFEEIRFYYELRWKQSTK
jgi:hypothetical protein